MSIFERRKPTRLTDAELAARIPNPDALLRGLSTEAVAARSRRDAAIAAASTHGLTQRQVAAATGLSVARVKQIQATGAIPRTATTLGPVTEVDLIAGEASEDARAERVFRLQDILPWQLPLKSERRFFHEQPNRGGGYDIGHDFCDVGTDRWVVAMATGTCEIYAFQAEGVGHQVDEEMESAARPGSTSGPLYILGQLPHQRYVEVALNSAAPRVAGRPGGLAWVVGRIQLINEALNATFSLNKHTLQAIAETLNKNGAQ